MNQDFTGLYVRCCYGKYRTFRLHEVSEQTARSQKYKHFKIISTPKASYSLQLLNETVHKPSELIISGSAAAKA